jgi:hypothetical protein
MRRTSHLRLSILGALLCAILLIVAHLVSHVSAQTNCTTCTNPPQLGRQDSWPQNSIVTVNISTSFSPAMRDCIEQAFRNWANSGTYAGVTFQFTYSSQPISGTNTVQIWRETPPPDPVNGPLQADTTPYYNANNTNLNHAVMRIDPGVTNCTAL